MRYLIIVKATPDTEAGRFPPEEQMRQLRAEMARFHEELHRAGALLERSGLKPSSKGWRVEYCGSRRVVLDGPFADTKELIAGYTLIQAKSREEALEWSRRFPNPAGEGRSAQIEVRELCAIEDVSPHVGYE
jgi:hypothetical protein